MAPTTTLEPVRVDVPAVWAVQHTSESASTPRAISAEMGRAFGRLIAYVERHGLVPAGAPRSIYIAYDPAAVRFTVAIPLTGPTDAPPTDDVEVAQLRGGPALRFAHHGPYERLALTYGAITAWMVEQGLMESEADWAKYSPMWEEYVTDPETTPPDKLLTYVYLPTTG